MSKGLVSVITPCYNTGHILSRLFDSLLSQTYPDIEVIAVNDGSTDDTSEVIESYVQRFQEKGYRLVNLYQENQGMAVAINNALKLIKGEYLVWPDSDDYYAADDAIEKMVASLATASSEFAVVRTLRRVVDEVTMEEMYVSGGSSKPQEDRSLFDDCLFIRNGFYFCAGAYMVRTDALREMTSMDIYTHKDAGQNWQILLPLLWKYRCLTIKEVLYNVVARKDSHSRDCLGYERKLARVEVYELTLLNTLDRIKTMPDSQIKEYKFQVGLKYLKERLGLAYSYRKRADFIVWYRNLAEKQKTGLTSLMRLRYFAVKVHAERLLDFFISIKHRII